MDPQILQLMFALAQGARNLQHEHTITSEEEQIPVTHDPFPVQTVIVDKAIAMNPFPAHTGERDTGCELTVCNPFPVQTFESATNCEQVTYSPFPVQPSEGAADCAPGVSATNGGPVTTREAHLGYTEPLAYERPQKVRPGFISNGLGTRGQRYEFATRFGAEHGPAKGGDVDCPLYSYEIDNVLKMAPDLNVLPAEFMPIMRSDPEKAREMFLAMSYPILLPVHCEMHWTAARITKGHVVSADSAQYPTHLTHLEFLVKALSKWTGSTFTLSLAAVPQQPPTSAECGVHTTINCLAMGWSTLLGSAGFADYSLLRPLMKRVEGSTLLPSGLLMAARALCARHHLFPFKPLTNAGTRSLLQSFAEGRSLQIIFRDPDTREFLREEVLAGPVQALPRGQIASVISTDFYNSLPLRLPLRYSISNPMSQLAQEIFGAAANTGKAPSVPLSVDEVKDILRTGKPHDRISVTMAETDEPPSMHTGTLIKCSRGRWSVELDLPDNRITDLMIPAEGTLDYQIQLTASASPLAAVPVVVTRPKRQVVTSAPPAPSVIGDEGQRPPVTSPVPVPAVAVPSADLADAADETVDPALQSPEIASLYRAYIEPKNGSTPGSLQRLSGETTTASQLLTLLVQPELTTISPAYRHHLAPSTIKQQQRTLRWLVQHLPPSDETLDVAIPLAVGRLAASRTWAPTTWHTRLLNIQGALVALFIYRPNQSSLTMARCPRWISALRTVAHLKPLHHPAQPLAITHEQVQKAIAL